MERQSTGVRVLTSSLCASPEVFAIATLQALLCTCQGIRLPDTHWGAVAKAHVSAKGFWEKAARRPQESSRPLGLWKLELKRLVLFQSSCKRHGQQMTDVQIMSMWDLIDKRQ